MLRGHWWNLVRLGLLCWLGLIAMAFIFSPPRTNTAVIAAMDVFELTGLALIVLGVAGGIANAAKTHRRRTKLRHP